MNQLLNQLSNDLFISGDWGTTRLRLRVVDKGRQRIIGEVSSTEGIAATFDRWLQLRWPQEKRAAFYQTALAGGLTRLQTQIGYPLGGLPIVMSGMASSSLGMV